jgi:hypothetical protein
MENQAKSYEDPKWAEFESNGLKTLVRTRSDFVFSANHDFVLGFSYKAGDIVYNSDDGLVYRAKVDNANITPDFDDTAIEGITWDWIAGSISGYVSGRGWWTKFADGTLFMAALLTVGSVVDSGAGITPRYYAIVTWTYPQVPYAGSIEYINADSITNYHDSNAGVGDSPDGGYGSTSVQVFVACNRADGITSPRNMVSVLCKARWKE